ncbi:DUF6881 domain-containing protein [Streptomyces sp. NPDC056500]|uniref:DUF6881 domain-containing protein n=1 Tax=Streptomyces sp. NPDC056500 TaxID=3345840 RepID=UPI0036BEFECF
MTERMLHAFLPPIDPNHPLLHISIAPHLGIDQFKAKERVENLRRARRVIQTYLDLGIPLLQKPSGEFVMAEDITDEMIARHENMITGEASWSAERFEEHLLNVIANNKGVRRISHRRIVRTGLSLHHPHSIVQEIDDQHRAEARRVELYPDGRMLWREDGEYGEGTADEEYTESSDVPGLSILNARTGQMAETITAEEFETLWEKATSGACGWICDIYRTALAPQTPSAKYCTRDRGDGSMFCTPHREAAQIMFPALFPAT